MDETVNKFLLAGNKFMPEMHLKQPRFTYSACGPFTKDKERIEKFMQTGNAYFVYRNELDKACFQHDMAYSKPKDLAKRTQSDKILGDKAFKLQVIQNMMVTKEDQLQWFTSFLIKNLDEVVLPLNHNIKLQMNFKSRLLEN